MTDLAREFRRLAEEAASRATPLPAAEVMRRGDRRRQRRVRQNAMLAICASAAVIAAAVLTGAAGRSTKLASPEHAAQVSCTATVTEAVAAGHLTVCVNYLYDHDGKVRLQAVAASFGSKAGYGVPYFGFVFRNATTGLVDAHFASRLKEANAATSFNSGWISPGSRHWHANKALFQANEELTVTLYSESPLDGVIFPVADVTVSLTRPGFVCKNDGETGGGVHVC